MKACRLAVWLGRSALLLALGACGQTEGPATSGPEHSSQTEPEGPSPGVPELVFGEYRRPHRIGVFTGEEWVEEQVQDLLVLHAGPGAGVTFELETVAENAHTCSMSGVAERAGGGLEYREVLDLPPDEEGKPFECLLRMKLEGERVVLEDLDHGCRLYYCGMRASLDGLSFERTGRGAEPLSAPSAETPQP